MRLSDYAHGKDNNFNLIRMLAALAVLFTHSFSISVGSQEAEPKFTLLGGMSLGTIAVDIFFITSGFLVTTSLLARRSVIDFVIARGLRILPALLIVLFLSVFVLGPYFTTLPIGTYFSHSVTYSYLMKCSSLVFKIAYDLPGVFETNPYPNVINGSLWSMKHEVRLYALLACLWVVASLTKSFKVSAFRTLVVVLALVLNGVLLAYVIAQEQVSAVLKLFSLFVSGAAYSVLKDRIPLSREVVWVLIAASVVCGVIDNLLFVVVYILSSPYVLLYVAYVPGGRIRRFNSIGDYSYGVYIYAFPVQQSLAALIPGVSPAAMFVMSLPVTLIFAVLSWHFMEARALTLKAYFSGKVRKLLPVQTLGLIERK